MKKVLVLLLSVAMIFALSACGGESSEEPQSDSQQTAAEESAKTASPDRDLPEGNYEDIGDGSFYLTGPSGSTENGDEIILYPEKDTIPHAYVGISLWDMDGSVQTYIYVDGVEMDKQQVGDGYEGSIDFDDDVFVSLKTVH